MSNHEHEHRKPDKPATQDRDGGYEGKESGSVDRDRVRQVTREVFEENREALRRLAKK